MNRLSRDTVKAQRRTVHLTKCADEPGTPIERLVVAALAEQGALPLDLLVQRVAGEMYREFCRSGATILDIGLFGSKLFVRDVIAEIEARDGSLWRIESDNPS